MVQGEQVQQDAQQPNPPQSGSSPDNGYGTAAMVMGILSLTVLGFIGAILALVFASISVREVGPNGPATAGKVMGIISLAITGVALVVIVIVFLVVAP